MTLPYAQAAALRMLVETPGYEGEGVVTSGASDLFDGQAFINWQTAAALERKGLVEIDRTVDEWTVRITLAGIGMLS